MPSNKALIYNYINNANIKYGFNHDIHIQTIEINNIYDNPTTSNELKLVFSFNNILIILNIIVSDYPFYSCSISVDKKKREYDQHPSLREISNLLNSDNSKFDKFIHEIVSITDYIF